MAERVQSYQKHTRWKPLFHFFVLPILLANVLVWVEPAAQQLADDPWSAGAGSLLTDYGVPGRFEKNVARTLSNLRQVDVGWNTVVPLARAKSSSSASLATFGPGISSSSM